jgi:hypothetical protein
MRASRILPEGDVPTVSLDLSRGSVATVLSVAALALVVPVGWLVIQFIAASRPDATAVEFRAGPAEVLVALAIAAGTLLLVVVAHELLHGAGFWLATGERPSFGFKGLYAYAAARDWYVPRGPYLLIGLAPLVVLSAALLGLVAAIPVSLLPVAFLAVVVNAVGSVGDVLVVAWLLARPLVTFVRDSGDAVTLYEREKAG